MLDIIYKNKFLKSSGFLQYYREVQALKNNKLYLYIIKNIEKDLLSAFYKNFKANNDDELPFSISFNRNSDKNNIKIYYKVKNKNKTKSYSVPRSYIRIAENLFKIKINRSLVAKEYRCYREKRNYNINTVYYDTSNIKIQRYSLKQFNIK